MAVWAPCIPCIGSLRLRFLPFMQQTSAGGTAKAGRRVQKSTLKWVPVIKPLGFNQVVIVVPKKPWFVVSTSSSGPCFTSLPGFLDIRAKLFGIPFVYGWFTFEEPGKVS